MLLSEQASGRERGRERGSLAVRASSKSTLKWFVIISKQKKETQKKMRIISLFHEVF